MPPEIAVGSSLWMVVLAGHAGVTPPMTTRRRILMWLGGPGESTGMVNPAGGIGPGCPPMPPVLAMVVLATPKQQCQHWTPIDLG